MYKILIVDDEAEIRKLLGAYFGKVGYAATALEGALLGLDILSKMSFDALISDINMPFMSGVEFAGKAKKLCPNLAILLLTGYGALDTAQEAIRIGVNDYVTKPVDLEKLKGSVDSAISAMNEKRQTQEYYDGLIRAASESKEKLDSAQAELMALISHELRTPVAVLSESFSILRDTIGVPDSQKIKGLNEKEKTAIFSCIERGNSRLIKVIDDINYYMGLYRGAVTVHTERVDLRDFLEENLGALEHVIPENRAILKKDFSLKDMSVTIDKEKLCDVLARLIHNAAYHNDKGTEITLTVCAEKKDGRDAAVIGVSDNGKGIETETLERIFKPFNVGDIDHHSKGLGLGLAICKKIVKLHSGELNLTSEKGKGTRATITMFVT